MKQELSFAELARESKKQALESASFRCQICGGMEKLHVHHIDGDSFNNDLDNLMVLCRSCHKSIHGKGKQTIAATVNKELVTWIDQQVKTQKFRNRSHLVEVALMKFKETQKKP